MRIPAALSRRTWVEKDRAAFPVDERFVAVPEHDQVDGRSGSGACRFQSGFAVVAVQQEHGARANLEPNTVGQCLDQVERVSVATDGNCWSYLFQDVEHRGVADVSGVQDEPDVRAAKKIDDWIQGTSCLSRGYVRVAHHSE